MTVKKSFCHLCLAECGINITVEDNKFIKINPDFNDPVSRGYVCEKSQKLINFQQSDDRVTSPLKKLNGVFVPISWEQAINEISIKLKSCLDSVMYMAPLSPSYFLNTDYSYELMSMLGVKFISNVHSTERAYMLFTHQSFFKSAIYPQRQEAQTLIVIGQNPWITQHYPRARIILKDIKNDPTRNLVVVDPIESETAKIADHHLKLNSGTDAWMLSALIKLLIENDAIDHNFIQQQTQNFDKLKEHFLKIDLDEYLKICGISKEQLMQIVTIFKTSESVAVDMGNGICHSLFPLANNYLVVLLYLLTGNFQKNGSMQSCETLFRPQTYMIEPRTPQTNQKQLNGVMPAATIANNLNFKCVIIDNCNPARRLPNSQKFKNSLSEVDLVIALDSFMTASTTQADYVLPTPTFFERYECVNVEHSDNKTIQLSRPVLPTPSFAKSSNEIYNLILERLDLIDHQLVNQLIKQYHDAPDEFYDKLIDIVNNGTPILYYVLQKTIGSEYQIPELSIVWSWLFKYNLSIYDLPTAVKTTNEYVTQLDTSGAVQIKNDTKQTHVIDLCPSFLLTTLKFSQSRLTEPGYSFILHCGYRQKSSLNEVIKNNSDPILEISVDDAAILNLVNNEQVLLQTKLTELKIKCKLVNNMQTGLIRIANHPIINELTFDDNIDYLNPQYKTVFANIRKIQ